MPQDYIMSRVSYIKRRARCDGPGAITWMETDTMASEGNFLDAWNHLASGARMAFSQQWMGLAAGGLPCGSSLLNEQEQIIALGRNHVYDLPEGANTFTTSPLQYTRVAHAEMNALAAVPSDREPKFLTLWTTQHPCIMCAAALRFIGVGKVWYIADRCGRTGDTRSDR
jgi:tRNA(Arg) A34 adenosine deaminase TadA